LLTSTLNLSWMGAPPCNFFGGIGKAGSAAPESFPSSGLHEDPLHLMVFPGTPTEIFFGTKISRGLPAFRTSPVGWGDHLTLLVARKGPRLRFPGLDRSKKFSLFPHPPPSYPLIRGTRPCKNPGPSRGFCYGTSLRSSRTPRYRIDLPPRPFSFLG